MFNNLNHDYIHFIISLKYKIAPARYRAALNVNKEMIFLYHHIGTSILKAQMVYGWGAKIIDQISKDLRLDCPHLQGFGPQNLKYMRKFAEEYKEEEISQQLVDQLP